MVAVAINMGGSSGSITPSSPRTGAEATEIALVFPICFPSIETFWEDLVYSSNRLGQCYGWRLSVSTTTKDYAHHVVFHE